MTENFELLKHIYKDAEMSCYTLHQLLEDLKEKDNKIKNRIEEILKKYEYFMDFSKEKLEEASKSLPKTGMMAKMGASKGIKKEVKCDNSDASIADMLIKGISMGSIDMEKKISAYQKEASKEDMALAKEFLSFQNEAIKHLKEFL